MIASLKYFLDEVEKLEPLFRVSELIQVGSYAEGTKIFQPDEFDFLAVVDVLSKPGTVVLKTDQKYPSGCVTVSLAASTLSSPLSNLCENGTLECFHGPPLSESFTGPMKFGKTFVRAVRDTYFKKVQIYMNKSDARGFISCSPLEINFVLGGGREVLLPPVNGIYLLLKAVEFKTPIVLLTYKFE